MNSDRDIDDGVIKYDRSYFEKTGPLAQDEYHELEKWRKVLFEITLIGEYLPQRVGYGNLSQKKDYQSIFQTQSPQFIISGTQTGGLSSLDGRHYTRVLDYDFDKLIIKAQGPLEASSEALTHAAIYASSPQIKAVFHIHHQKIWAAMIENDYLSTPQDIPYGTKEMALKVQETIQGQGKGVLVMKGHEDGVIAFGANLDEAGNEILKLYDKFER